MKSSQSDLEEFRRRWRQELQSASNSDPSQSPSRRIKTESSGNTQSRAESSRTDQAVELYLSAEALESTGDVYGALALYQRAVQLDADVEQHVRQLTSQHRAKSEEGRGRVGSSNVDVREHPPVIEESTGSLVELFGRLTASDPTYCSPAISTNECHISKLPVDLVQHLLLWVVSDDVDIISLERLASVSRGFYLQCRSGALWRRICLRVHGPACLSWTAANSPSVDWRSLYLSRTPLRFDGCYSARASYVRHADDSGFRDSTFCGWQLVVHYRLMRLTADGRAFMVLGSEGPQTGWRRLLGDGGGAVISGRYRIKGDRVLAVLHKPHRDNRRQRKGAKKEKNAYDPGEQHLHMDLLIKRDDVRGLHLCWNSYEIMTRYGVDSNRGGTNTGIRERIDSVTINDQFPPLVFTCVPEFMASAEQPLP